MKIHPRLLLLSLIHVRSSRPPPDPALVLDPLSVRVCLEDSGQIDLQLWAEQRSSRQKLARVEMDNGQTCFDLDSLLPTPSDSVTVALESAAVHETFLEATEAPLVWEIEYDQWIQCQRDAINDDHGSQAQLQTPGVPKEPCYLPAMTDDSDLPDTANSEIESSEPSALLPEKVSSNHRRVNSSPSSNDTASACSANLFKTKAKFESEAFCVAFGDEADTDELQGCLAGAEFKLAGPSAYFYESGHFVQKMVCWSAYHRPPQSFFPAALEVQVKIQGVKSSFEIELSSGSESGEGSSRKRALASCGSETISGTFSINDAVSPNSKSSSTTVNFDQSSFVSSSVDCPVTKFFVSSSLPFSGTTEAQASDLQVTVNPNTPQKVTKYFKAVTTGGVESSVITWTVTVCGNEVPSSKYPYSELVMEEVDATAKTPVVTYTKATYSEWFSTDYSHAEASSACSAATYSLAGSADGSSIWLANGVITIDSSSGDLQILQTTEVTSLKGYLIMTTQGGKTASREIDVTIMAVSKCSSVAIQVTKSLDYLVLPKTTDSLVTLDLESYFGFSSADDTLCPITLYKAYPYFSSSPAFRSTLGTLDWPMEADRLYFLIEAYNDAKHIRISFELIICGNEVLAQKDGVNTLVSYASQLNTWTSIPFSSYFNLDGTASNTHPDCAVVKSVQLFTDSALTQEYSGSSILVRSDELLLLLSTAVRFDLFWVVTTPGLVKETISLSLMVCGFETVNFNPGGPLIQIPFAVDASGTSKTFEVTSYVTPTPDPPQCTLETMTIKKQTGTSSWATIFTGDPATAVSQTLPVDAAATQIYEYSVVTKGSISASIQLEFVVCGDEVVSSVSADAFEISHQYLLTQGPNLQISTATIASWFSVAAGTGKSSGFANCAVSSYALCKDSACSELSSISQVSLSPTLTLDAGDLIDSPTGFSHFALDLIKTPNKATAVVDYQVDLVQSFSFFIGAASIGYKFGSREVKVSIVCGAEELSLASSGSIEYLQMSQSRTPIVIQKSVYKNYYENTMSEMCPVVSYEVAFVSLQKDGESIVLTSTAQARSIEEREFLTNATEASKLNPLSEDLVIDATELYEVGIYKYKLTATTEGTIAISKTIELNMTTLNDTAAAIANFVPYFESPLLLLTLNVSENEGKLLKFSSPSALDTENNEIEIGVELSIRDRRFLTYKINQNSIEVAFEVDQIRLQDLGLHQIKVSLTDNVTQMVAHYEWEFDLVAADSFGVVIVPVVEVYEPQIAVTRFIDPMEREYQQEFIVPEIEPSSSSKVQKEVFDASMKAWKQGMFGDQELEKGLQTLPVEASTQGEVMLRFEEPIIVPAFLAVKSEDSRRRLEEETIALDQIDVSRDVFEVQFIMKSDVQVPMDYRLELISWDQNGIAFEFHFGDSLLISQGEEPDEALIAIRDPYMFVGWKSKKLVTMPKLRFALPRQMPEGDSFKSADRRSNGYGRFLQVLCIMYLFAMLYMDGDARWLGVGFFAIQTVANLIEFDKGLPLIAKAAAGNYQDITLRSLIGFIVFSILYSIGVGAKIWWNQDQRRHGITVKPHKPILHIIIHVGLAGCQVAYLPILATAIANDLTWLVILMIVPPLALGGLLYYYWRDEALEDDEVEECFQQLYDHLRDYERPSHLLQVPLQFFCTWMMFAIPSLMAEGSRLPMLAALAMVRPVLLCYINPFGLKRMMYLEMVNQGFIEIGVCCIQAFYYYRFGPVGLSGQGLATLLALAATLNCGQLIQVTVQKVRRFLKQKQNQAAYEIAFMNFMTLTPQEREILRKRANKEKEKSMIVEEVEQPEEFQPRRVSRKNAWISSRHFFEEEEQKPVGIELSSEDVGLNPIEVVEGAVVSPRVFNEDSVEERLIPHDVRAEQTPSSPPSSSHRSSSHKSSSSKSRKKKTKKRQILETKMPLDQIHEVDSSRMDTHRSQLTALNSARPDIAPKKVAPSNQIAEEPAQDEAQNKKKEEIIILQSDQLGGGDPVIKPTPSGKTPTKPKIQPKKKVKEPVPEDEVPVEDEEAPIQVPNEAKTLPKPVDPVAQATSENLTVSQESVQRAPSGTNPQSDQPQQQEIPEIETKEVDDQLANIKPVEEGPHEDVPPEQQQQVEAAAVGQGLLAQDTEMAEIAQVQDEEEAPPEEEEQHPVPLEEKKEEPEAPIAAPEAQAPASEPPAQPAPEEAPVENQAENLPEVPTQEVEHEPKEEAKAPEKEEEEVPEEEAPLEPVPEEQEIPTIPDAVPEELPAASEQPEQSEKPEQPGGDSDKIDEELPPEDGEQQSEKQSYVEANPVEIPTEDIEEALPPQSQSSICPEDGVKQIGEMPEEAQPDQQVQREPSEIPDEAPPDSEVAMEDVEEGEISEQIEGGGD